MGECIEARGGLCIGVMPTCMLNEWRSLAVGEGGQEKGCRDQLIYHMPAGANAANPFSARALCLSKRERVPFNADQKKGGQLFSGGALISIALSQKKLQPPSSY